MTDLYYAEVFAGVGGLSIGLERAGFKPAWHAEIEEFPRRVLKHHWPQIPLYGDVCEINGYEMREKHGDLAILSGGSPCQDLSVAGKREGLKGKRSGLFFEQMRLWDETGAPLCLWENVDGARSSNDGKDFAEVLGAFVGGHILVPNGGWGSAGVAVGATGIAAWRVLDAQYFGVPQRRRRIIVLGSRSLRISPEEILLEPESLRWNSPKGRAAWQSFAQRAQGSSGNGERRRPVDAPQIFENHGQDSRFKEVSESPAINAKAGTGGNNLPLVVAFNEAQITHPDNRASMSADKTPTLDASGRMDVMGFHIKQDPISSNNLSPALGTTTDGMAILPVFRMQGFGDYEEDAVVSSLKSRDHKDATDLILDQPKAFKASHFTRGKDGAPSDIVPTLSADSDRGDQDNLIVGTLESRDGGKMLSAQSAAAGHLQATLGRPRRLMPIECERLQSWDDNWTDVPSLERWSDKLMRWIARKKPKHATDSERYKAIGNGVASNVVHWIGLRIIENLERNG